MTEPVNPSSGPDSITSSIAPRRPVLLMILDGFGVNPCPIHNAVAQAKTPRLDQYFSQHSLTLLQASGQAVGLPDGQMGNSEVGHLTIGCGDIIRQDLVAIDDAIGDGSFYQNKVLTETISKAKQNNRPVHLMGLVSNGGVHSHIRHLSALIEMCQRHTVKPVLHMFTDGRDTDPHAALGFLEDIEPAIKMAGGFIATIGGRFYAMDRDNRWDRIESAWSALVKCEGEKFSSAREAITCAYEKNLTDEFIPMSVLPHAEPLTHEDSVIFFNFRKDRARQITAALFRDEFKHFDRGEFQPITVTCMTEYDEWYLLPFAFRQDKPATTLAETISRNGLKQFHCAETEKYAHVTYFLNGRRGDAYSGEERVIIPSPKVTTYDEQPAMSAAAVASDVINAIESNCFGFIAVNFANGDMLGHTGKLESTIESLEAMDADVGNVLDAAVSGNYSVVLTADHGNCEQMIDYATGAEHTQHTIFPVPCLIIDKLQWRLSCGAGLSSIAPTVLHLMGLQKPETMTGRSLLLHPASHQS